MPRKKLVAKLTAVFEHEDKWWCVSIPEVSGCQSAGRSLGEARRNIREALATCVDVFGDEADAVAKSAVILEEIRLPARAKRVLAKARKEREAAAAQASRAQTATVSAARELGDEGLSLRDVGELLGLSHERVKQLSR